MITNGIKVRKVDDDDRPWLVNVAKSLFGKQIRKRFLTKKEADAQAHSYAMKLKSKGQTPLEPELHKLVAVYANKLTVGQFATMLEEGVRRYSVAALPMKALVEEYLEHNRRRRARGTISEIHLKTLECLAPKLVEYMGNPLVRDIDEDMIEALVDKRLASTNKKGEKTSPRTVISEVDNLKTILKYAMSKKYITHNPATFVDLPTYKPEVGICKPEDLEKLLEHADHYVQSWIMFGAFGGLRSSEIMLMRWEDVRLDEGQFYIHGTKNGNAERWVKLTPPLMDFCKQLLGSDNPPKGLVMNE